MLQDTLNAARRELDALSITRDWYIVDIHDAPLPVALWRTFIHRRPLVRLNSAIEAQRDIVDYLESSPVQYRLHPAALPCIDDALFDLVDVLGDSDVTVTGVIDGRTVDTVDGVLIVKCNEIEQYRVVCGDAALDTRKVTDLAVDLEGRLRINTLTLECAGGRATITEPSSPLTDSARAALDLLCARDLLLSGEIDGAVVISEQLETAVRVTARIKGEVVYERSGDHALELDAEALCKAISTLPAHLHGHSLANRFSDVRAVSNISGALVTVNHWQAARIKPAAH
jgi:hypothetical protein